MVERRYKFKSRTLDYVILVIVLLAAGLFAYARIAGKRTGMQDGIVNRRVVPSIAFMGERVNVELKIDADYLPRCDLPQPLSDPVYVVMVMDTSGSMMGPKLTSAKAAATEFVDLLDLDIDRVALVQFDDKARTLSRGFKTSREGIMRSIQRLSVGDMTNMGAGLQNAYELIQESEIPPNAKRLIVLLSDGEYNTGSDPEPVAQRIRDDLGFRIISVALGSANPAQLSQLVEDPTTDVVASSDASDLVRTFGEIAGRYVNIVATEVALYENYNADAFRFEPLSALTADTSQRGTVRWAWSFLGDRGRNAGYQLRPRKMGSHQVVTVPGEMSLLSCEGQPYSQVLPSGPSILVLFPWWIFLILAGIGLLWLLYRLLEEIRLGKAPYGPPPPDAPIPHSVAPTLAPGQQGSPTGDWHGRRDI